MGIDIRRDNEKVIYCGYEENFEVIIKTRNAGYDMTLARLCDDLDIPLWKGMELGKYFKYKIEKEREYKCPHCGLSKKDNHICGK